MSSYSNSGAGLPNEGPMVANKKFWRPPFPSVGSRCRNEAELIGNTSLLQILAAADMADDEDVAIRKSLFVALRDFDADSAAGVGPDTRSLRARSGLRHCRHAP